MELNGALQRHLPINQLSSQHFHFSPCALGSNFVWNVALVLIWFADSQQQAFLLSLRVSAWWWGVTTIYTGCLIAGMGPFHLLRSGSRALPLEWAQWENTSTSVSAFTAAWVPPHQHRQQDFLLTTSKDGCGQMMMVDFLSDLGSANNQTHEHTTSCYFYVNYHLYHWHHYSLFELQQ